MIFISGGGADGTAADLYVMGKSGTDSAAVDLSCDMIEASKVELGSRIHYM